MTLHSAVRMTHILQSHGPITVEWHTYMVIRLASLNPRQKTARRTAPETETRTEAKAAYIHTPRPLEGLEGTGTDTGVRALYNICANAKWAFKIQTPYARDGTTRRVVTGECQMARFETRVGCGAGSRIHSNAVRCHGVFGGVEEKVGLGGGPSGA
ncbi:hypothetical protein K438DRAFT_1779950 [Mycena galopus ATCC 62051]|nr:hypothetical protein K438DRAFT_1783643 [Mycena galopus ATCC 62051]KAF8147627.1 hypothetical protein K438DRAFT_1779950 [Mycena galopus ATCC 62051]